MEADNFIAKTTTTTIAIVRHTGRTFALYIALMGCGAMLLLMYVWIWTTAAVGFLLRIVADVLEEVYGPEGKSLLFPSLARAPSGLWGDGAFDFGNVRCRWGLTNSIELRVKRSEWPLSSEELRRRTLEALEMWQEARTEAEAEARVHDEANQHGAEHSNPRPGDHHAIPGQIDKMALDDDDDDDWSIPWPSDRPGAPREQPAEAPDEHLAAEKDADTEEKERPEDSSHTQAKESNAREEGQHTASNPGSADIAAKPFPIAPHRMAKKPAQQSSVAEAAIVQKPAVISPVSEQRRSAPCQGSNNGPPTTVAVPTPPSAAKLAVDVPEKLQNPTSRFGQDATLSKVAPNFRGQSVAWMDWAMKQSSKAIPPPNRIQQPEIQRPAAGWAAAAAAPPAPGPEPWNIAPSDPAKTAVQPKPECVPPYLRPRKDSALKAPTALPQQSQSSGDWWNEGPRLSRPSSPVDALGEAAELSSERPTISFAPSTSTSEFLPSLKGDARALAEARAIRQSQTPPRDRRKQPSHLISRPSQRSGFAALLNKPQTVAPVPPQAPSHPKVQFAGANLPPHRRLMMHKLREAQAAEETERNAHLKAKLPSLQSTVDEHQAEALPRNVNAKSSESEQDNERPESVENKASVKSQPVPPTENQQPPKATISGRRSTPASDAPRKEPAEDTENGPSSTASLLDDSIPSLSDDASPAALMNALTVTESKQHVPDREVALAAAVTALNAQAQRKRDPPSSLEQAPATDTAAASAGYQHADLILLDDEMDGTTSSPSALELMLSKECIGSSADRTATENNTASRSSSPDTVIAPPTADVHGEEQVTASGAESESTHCAPSPERIAINKPSDTDGMGSTDVDSAEKVIDTRAALRKELVDKARTAFNGLRDAANKGRKDAEGRMKLQRTTAFYKKRRAALMKEFPEDELLKTELVGEEELIAKWTAKA